MDKELENILIADEKFRQKNPSCYNCLLCYREYGTDFCKKHDYPLEDMEQKCEDWR